MFALKRPPMAAILSLEILLIAVGNAVAKKPAAAPPAPPAASVVYTGADLAKTLLPSSTAPIASQYFGMHIHHLADPNLPLNRQTPFPSFPVSTLRLIGSADWFTIERTRDTYDWKRMDATIRAANRNGVSDFIFTFGYVPQWASSNPSDSCGSGWMPGHCDAPANLADLDDFANRLVQRYCGVVKYYETWNEPSALGYWVGTNAQMLEIAKHVYAAAKSPANCGCTKGSCKPGKGVNPNKVLLPSINATTSPSARLWLENYLSYAGNPYPYADIGAFHGYGYTANPEAIQDGVRYMKSMLARYGMGSAELWDTEASWGLGGLPDGDKQASWVIRYELVQALSGVSRFTWYAYDDCQWGGLWNGPLCAPPASTPASVASGPSEASVAYATAQKWLTGAAPQSCNVYADGTWLCKITRSGGYMAWVAWNSKGTPVTLQSSSLAGLVQYRNWKNEKLMIADRVDIGAVPILLENTDGF